MSNIRPAYKSGKADWCGIYDYPKTVWDSRWWRKGVVALPWLRGISCRFPFNKPRGKPRISSDFPKVRSGIIILPNPSVPEGVWEIAETEEMKEVIGLYGKTFHFWQTDRGDNLPLGRPELMMSFTKSEQVTSTSLEQCGQDTNL